MELKWRVQVSSSWEPSVQLQDILYLNNQAGNVVEGPEGPGHPSLTLSQPAGQTEAACFLHIRELPQLSGYVVCGVELQSSSRTVEVYSEEEYIATSQGVFMESDQERKLYHCKLTLPADSICNQLTLKLLSLRGKTCVHVARLVLVVAEDYGGISSKMDPAVPIPSKASDLQSLIGSLPLQSHKSNAPPFLQGLLSSLQHLTSPDQPAEEQPLDITQMISAFRQLRPATSHPEGTKTEATREERGEPEEESAQTKEPVDEDQISVSLKSVEAMMDKKIEQLEERLRRYVDTKMAAILKQIEIKLEQRSDVKGSEVNEGDSGLDRHMVTQNVVLLEEQLD